MTCLAVDQGAKVDQCQQGWRQAEKASEQDNDVLATQVWKLVGDLSALQTFLSFFVRGSLCSHGNPSTRETKHKKKKHVVMREIVSLHLGQAGCGIGAAFWDLLCRELSSSTGEEAINKEVFFRQGNDGTFLPRALFADPDPESLRKVASVRKWENQTFHSGREDAASNYVRGRFVVNMNVAPSLGEALRLTLEQCDSPQGLLLTYSLAGGGGSSLAAMVSEGANALGGDIKDLLHKKTKVSVSLFPSPRFSSCIVEPYNTVWALSELEEDTDLAIHVDNESLHSLALGRGTTDPFFPDLNNLVAQTVASVTQGFRFYGSHDKQFTSCQRKFEEHRNQHSQKQHKHHASHTNLDSLATALVPFASLRHVSAYQGWGEEGLQGWSPMLEVNTLEGHSNSLSTCVFYSGSLTSTDVQARVESLDKTLQLFSRTQISVHNIVEVAKEEPGCCWRPTKEALHQADWRACKLSNESSFASNLGRVGVKFDEMFAKRAFVHWFVGIGIEDDTFSYVRNDVRAIEQSYLEADQ